MQIKISTLPAITLCALCSQHAYAGGIMLYEIGTDNAGLANAGAAARAQGPSTIASNPAGMSYLPGTQITAGLQVLYGDLSFDRDSGTNTPGSGSGNSLDPMPGGSFFISHELDEHWSVGSASTVTSAWRSITTTTGPAATSRKTPACSVCRWCPAWRIASTSSGRSAWASRPCTAC